MTFIFINKQIAKNDITLKKYMKTKTSILLLILSFTFIKISAQMASSNTKPWTVNNKLEYTGTYHFGTSDFVLSYTNGTFEAKIINSQLNEDATARIEKREPVSNIRIEGNTFYSNKTKGEFVIFKNDATERFGLKVYEPWNDKKDIEIGKLTSTPKRYIGNYPYTSFRELTTTDLKYISKSDLQIMRNEIYARYGHIFTAGGIMDTHFKKQSWYKCEYSDATFLLTSIEKNNIKIIKQVEQEQKTN